MSFWRNIPRPIIGLSPMDGVTDASFRFIAAKHGKPDVMFTEFVNIQAAFYSPHTLIKDLTYAEIERPVVAQIYGRAPELFYQVAHIVAELGFDGLDINMGCPSRKVAASGCGAALIRDPELARQIIRAARRGIEDWCNGQSLDEAKIDTGVVASIEAANRRRTRSAQAPARRRIPVSVKTRLGYDRDVVADWIPVLLEEQPSVISLHGRTLQQGYKGSADWEAIARAAGLARGSDTLILGNGDVQDLAEARRRVGATGVAGVLLGRAVQGNPWIFSNKQRLKRSPVESAVPDSVLETVSLAERFRVIIEHSEHYEELSSKQNFVAMRKHLAWYCKGFRGAAELRSRMVRVRSADDVAACLAQFSARYSEETAGTSSHEPAFPIANHAAL